MPNLNDLNNYTCSSISTLQGWFFPTAGDGLDASYTRGRDASYTRGSSAYIQHATLKSKTAYPISLGIYVHTEDELIISYYNHTLGTSANTTYVSECFIVSRKGDNDLRGQGITGLRITNKSFKAFNQN